MHPHYVLCVFFLLNLYEAQGKEDLPTILKPHTSSVGKERVTLSWTLAGGNEDLAFRNEIVYQVYDKTQNPNRRSTQTVHTAKDQTSVTIPDLRSGTTYEAQIHTKTDSTDGKWSAKILFTTSGLRPPRTLNIRSITDTTVTVEWTPPIGDPPEQYKISLKRSDEEGGIVPKIAPVSYPVTEYVIWGLLPGTPYSLFLQTKVGEEYSTKMRHGFATNTGTVLKSSFDTPQKTSVVIKWETISSRSLIARYDVEIIDIKDKNPKTRIQIHKTHGNQEVRNLLVNDLKPGTFYSFRVRSVYRENGGRGKWSEVNYFTTDYADPPGQPTGGNITDYAKTSAMFRWTAPSSDIDIQYYEVEYGKKKERPLPIIDTASTATNYLLSDLESGTLYEVKTRAVAGYNLTGKWSTYSTFTTNGPKPVSAIEITEIYDKSAVVSWTVYSDGKADQFKLVLTETVLQASVVTKLLNVSNPQFTLTKLKPATGYSLEIVIIKDGEESSVKRHGFATNSNLDTLAKQPQNPIIASRTPQQSLSVLHYGFDKIPNVFIKYYTINIQGFNIPNIPFDRIETFSPSIGGSRQEIKLDNIQSGYKYKIKSRGVFNDGNEGKWSTIVSTIVPGPKPVIGLTMREITDTDVVVNWESGYQKSDALFNSQEYIVTLSKYAENNELNKIDEALVSSLYEETQFQGRLLATERYSVQIVTRILSMENGEQFSTPRILAFRADSEKVKAPTLNNIQQENGDATISWNRLMGRNDIKYYDVEFKKSTDTGYQSYKTDSGLTDRMSFKDLKDDIVYQFRVRAVDMFDKKGRWLEQSFTINHGLKEDVNDLKVTKISSSTATLVWDPPKSLLIKMYQIELKSPSRNLKEIIVTRGLTTQFTLDDLHPATSYSYRVRTVSVNEDIKGNWSPQQFFTTSDESMSSANGTGVIIAVVIGVIVLIIAVIVIVLLCKKRQNNKSAHNRFNARFSKNDDGMKEIA